MCFSTRMWSMIMVDSELYTFLIVPSLSKLESHCSFFFCGWSLFGDFDYCREVWVLVRIWGATGVQPWEKPDCWDHRRSIWEALGYLIQWIITNSSTSYKIMFSIPGVALGKANCSCGVIRSPTFFRKRLRMHSIHLPCTDWLLARVIGCCHDAPANFAFK